VIAALRGLEARGKIALRYEEAGLCAHLPGEAPRDEQGSEDDQPETLREAAERRRQAVEQARAALIYLLRETRAYRLAYATQSVEALLHGGS